MFWIIINLISAWLLIGLIAYDIRLIKQGKHDITEFYQSLISVVEAQTKFNNSATENIERHEEALKIIVNYIKAGETHDIGA